jgi:hypothetical protein
MLRFESSEKILLSVCHEVKDISYRKALTTTINGMKKTTVQKDISSR